MPYQRKKKKKNQPATATQQKKEIRTESRYKNEIYNATNNKI